MHLDTDNKEWIQATQIIQYSRHSLFLTGKAGTGKSTFLRYIAKNTKKKTVILAPTGIAAGSVCVYAQMYVGRVGVALRNAPLHVLAVGSFFGVDPAPIKGKLDKVSYSMADFLLGVPTKGVDVVLLL